MAVGSSRRAVVLSAAMAFSACGGDGEGSPERAPELVADADAGVVEASALVPPSDVTASADDADAVRVSWTAPAGARPTGYVVLRDGVDLIALGSGTTSYLDVTASPGGVSMPTMLNASDAGRMDGIELTWAPSTTNPGAEHVYAVVALSGGLRSDPSSSTPGRRVAPSVAYELSRDGGTTWLPAGSGTAFVDADAPLGTQAATVRARVDVARSLVLVGLESTSSEPPPFSTYLLRATSRSATSASAGPATGRRGGGIVTSVQWQRSTGDSDGSYADVTGATGMVSFDTDPPFGGHYYRAVLRREGYGDAFTRAMRVVPQPLESISAGDQFACAIRKLDKALVCWGGTPYFPDAGEVVAVAAAGRAVCVRGALDGKTTCSALLPVPTDVDLFSSIAAGGERACGVRSGDRTVSCWGAPPLQPFDEPSGAAFKSIAVGGHICGIREDGKLVCWAGTSATPGIPTTPTADEFASLSVGRAHVCAVRASDAKVVCWGSNSNGQAPSAPTTESFESVAAGGGHTCGIRTTDRHVRCWGAHLGAQTPPEPTVAFEAISAGFGFTCGLRTGGRVRCWGDTRSAEMPRTEIVKEVVAGDRYTCVRDVNDKALCFGTNDPGTTRETPYKALAAGPSVACGIRQTDDRVECWAPGQSPLVASGLGAEPMTRVAIGGTHVCGITKPGGHLRCVGSNTRGAPTGPTAETFKDVVIGRYFTCALAADGKVRCWGEAYAGAANPPDSVRLGTFTQIVSGLGHVCGLRDDGRRVCWGGTATSAPAEPSTATYDTLAAANGYTCGVRSVDKQVECIGSAPWAYGNAGLAHDAFRSVAGGLFHVCAVRASDSKLVCWGETAAAPQIVP